MENLEEWSSVMEEKMVRFDVVDRLSSAFSNVKKKEEAKAKHEENIIHEEMLRRKMQEELKIQEMKLQINSKDWNQFESEIDKAEIGTVSKFF